MTDLLVELGVPERCIQKTRSVEEKGRSFVLSLPADWQVRKVCVDGCLITGEGSKRVDALFHIHGTPRDSTGLSRQAVVLVELKGKDLGHALQQVEATLQYLNRLPAWRRAEELRRSAFVVLSNGRQVPQYQQQRLRLLKQYGVEVRWKSQRMLASAEDVRLSESTRATPA